MVWRDVPGQVVRYAVSGVILAGVYSAVYWIAAMPVGLPALVANTIAFAVNFVLGWLLHSRWSFRGHGLTGPAHVARARFLSVNLLGFALNSFWVWLIVERLGGTVAASILPIVLVTPCVNFWLSRTFVFDSNRY